MPEGTKRWLFSIGLASAILTAGIAVGVNSQRLADQEVRNQWQDAAIAALQHNPTEIAVLQSQVAELSKKVEQLQVVVIETRNAVLGRGR